MPLGEQRDLLDHLGTESLLPAIKAWLVVLFAVH